MEGKGQPTKLSGWDRPQGGRMTGVPRPWEKGLSCQGSKQASGATQLLSAAVCSSRAAGGLSLCACICIPDVMLNRSRPENASQLQVSTVSVSQKRRVSALPTHCSMNEELGHDRCVALRRAAVTGHRTAYGVEETRVYDSGEEKAMQVIVEPGPLLGPGGADGPKKPRKQVSSRSANTC